MAKDDVPNDGLFFVKSVGKYYAIKVTDINWIYAKGNYCQFHLEGNKEYSVRTSLNLVLENFNADELVQIHRNYLINYTKIEMYDPLGTIQIDNQSLPLSKKYKNDLEQKLNILK